MFLDGSCVCLDWLQSLKPIFHQCVMSYTCSQSNYDDGSVKTEPSEFDWLQVFALF